MFREMSNFEFVLRMTYVVVLFAFSVAAVVRLIRGLCDDRGPREFRSPSEALSYIIRQDKK